MVTMKRQVEIIRNELLDLSRRNKFINYKTSNTKGLEIENINSEKFYQQFVKYQKTYSFINAMESRDALNEKPKRLLKRSVIDPVSNLMINYKLPTLYEDNELDNRLKKTHADASRFLQEQGMNLLFLGLGMLDWYEQKTIHNQSPIIFIPVELIRTNIKTRFRLRYTGSEIITNKSLLKKLEEAYKIKFPSHLLDIEDDAEFDIKNYFKEFNELIKRPLKQYDLKIDYAVLNLFTYNRFIMFNDLNPDIWSGNSLLNHEILNKLFRSGFNESLPVLKDEELIDENGDILDIHNVLEADSSQTLAIHAVNEGRNLVIWGPPGTGKSQTITNIIAESIRRGKSVLFVSEKMAALEVVKNRLEAVGLGDACLEIHSDKTNKQQTVEEIKRTFELNEVKRRSFHRQIASIKEYRQKLNDYMKSVNTPIEESNFTAHNLIGELLNINEKLKGYEMPSIQIDNIIKLNELEYVKRRNLIAEVNDFITNNGTPVLNPFWGIDLNNNLSANDSRKLFSVVDKTSSDLTILLNNFCLIKEKFKINVQTDLYLIKELMNLLTAVFNLPKLVVNYKVSTLTDHKDFLLTIVNTGMSLQNYQKIDKRLKKRTWDLSDKEVLSLYEIRENIKKYHYKWYRNFIGSYRKSIASMRKLLKRGIPYNFQKRISIINTLISYYEFDNQLKANKELLMDLLGTEYSGINTDWKFINNFLVDLYKTIDDANKLNIDLTAMKHLYTKRENYFKLDLDEVNKIIDDITNNIYFINTLAQVNLSKLNYQRVDNIDLDAFNQKIGSWLNNKDQIYKMITYNNYVGQLNNLELTDFVKIVDRWETSEYKLVDVLDKYYYECLLDHAKELYPALNYFDKNVHENIIDNFTQNEERIISEYNRIVIAKQHTANIRKLKAVDAAAISVKSQLGSLQSEFHKKRVSPLRKIFSESFNPIKIIKPIFMMSPLSVAKYLQPASGMFDLVVFDEASQIRPQDAIGAISRAKQVVVVGDDKQLPPTSFFDSITETNDEEIGSIADYESILKKFLTSGANVSMLKWHYRSQHESLINLSNKFFYDEKLYIFPSPISVSKELGLKYHFVDGFYDRGKTQTNIKEAKYIARMVIEHAKNKPHESLGVATLNSRQMDAILDEIEKLRHENLDLESFFAEDKVDHFFVKNLESIQGDERDVILISIGYNKDQYGKLLMNFGPLNNEGGERRLNVLVTRARKRCEVITGLKFTDIDTEKTKALGVAVLREFLKLAEASSFEKQLPNNKIVNSPLENHLYQQLTNAGFKVVNKVGNTNFAIDLAVVHPEKSSEYILGITCDGPTYAASKSARDRDRLRNLILSSKGWNIYHLWSASYFNDEEKEYHAITKTIKKIINQDGNGSKVLKTESKKTPFIVERLDSDNIVTKTMFNKYKYRNRIINEIEIILDKKPHLLEEYVLSIIKNETPVHRDLIIKRIKDMSNLSRITPKLKKAVNMAIASLQQKNLILFDGDFVFLEDDIITFRDRRELDKYFINLDYISNEEIMAAVFNIININKGVTVEGVANIIAKYIGYKRTDEKIVNKVKSNISFLIDKEIVVFDNYGYIHFNNDTLVSKLKYRKGKLTISA